MKPGPQNLITDVPGVMVGQAQDDTLKSGATILRGPGDMVASVSIMGGAPATRDIALLEPDRLVQKVDALLLSGGSAFGMDAAGGAMQALVAQGIGFPVGDARVPIVPTACLFDLLNGGDKNWATSPYPALGATAVADLSDSFAIGSHGAGAGAIAGPIKGGTGSASITLDNGTTIGALVAVNSVGSVTMADSPHFWAAPFEVAGEFGGLGPMPDYDPTAAPVLKTHQGENTTIAVIVTDADLTQAQAKRMATAAHDGMARAIFPSHTPFDGDLIFAASTGARPMADPVGEQLMLGHAASICLARAIARGVYAATPAPGDTHPTWQSRFAPSR